MKTDKLSLNKFAAGAIQELISQRLSQKGTDAMYAVAARLPLLVGDFVEYHNECKKVRLTIDDVAQLMPADVWARMDKHQRKSLELACAVQSNIINKQMETFKRILFESMDSINKLSEQMQEKIFNDSDKLLEKEATQ